MKFNDHIYLRAEHLLKGGRFIAARVTIADIIEDCPMKRGNRESMRTGLAFVKSDKILGLNATNYSLVCWELGDGRPQDWIGKTITLVVRLVTDNRTRQLQPAIRVWPTKPHPRSAVREQMGSEITDNWYEQSTQAT